MSEFGEQCQHGSLKRSCELCERDAEIDELRSNIELYWRPIETAPKKRHLNPDYDGPPIIAASEDDVEIVHWNNLSRKFFTYARGEDEFGESFDNPTHWMPLPEPPQETNMNETDQALDDMLNGVSKPTFEDYAELVRQWASDRQIIQNSTAAAQLEKLDEERQETIEAIYQYMFREELSNDPAKAWDEVVDGFGDQLVCICNVAAIAGVDLTDALAHAYEQIKDRTGRLRSDGIFEKDEASHE